MIYKLQPLREALEKEGYIIDEGINRDEIPYLVVGTKGDRINLYFHCNHIFNSLTNERCSIHHHYKNELNKIVKRVKEIKPLIG